MQRLRQLLSVAARASVPLLRSSARTVSCFALRPSVETRVVTLGSRVSPLVRFCSSQPVKSGVREILSEAEFESALSTAKEANNPVVIDFYATWCPPCKAFAPVFGKAAEKEQNIVFLKLNVDEVQSVAAEFGIEAIPTIVALPTKGDAVQHKGAMREADFDRFLKQYVV